VIARFTARHIVYLTFCLPLLTLSGQARSADDLWAETLATASQSVVSLQLANLRNFDDTDQGDSNATGFVVDAERGLVLTNRHVVGAGPVRLSATFQNQERVDGVPLYRDPIHDFAFVRYNPDDLKYAQPNSLPLRPEKIRTGLNIRVIGSDGGEQLSSGGSSGSPVIDFDGDVVALNAAANTKTASSFFLPLPRIQYALERLQKNMPIDRGGLQTIFTQQPFRELAKFGLSKELEDQARQHDANNNGMLMVSQVIAGGVADEILEEGDILVSINDQLITNFIELESLLDSSIGKEMSIRVVRQGEIALLKSKVADLHELEPVEFLELGDAILQNMSIQHSRAMDKPQKGVVVMRAGYFFNRASLPQGSVIVELDGKPVNHLEDFISVVRAASGDKKLVARYIVPGREQTTSQTQIELDSKWFSYRRCKRVDDARFWDCKEESLPTINATTNSGQVRVPTFRDPLLNTVAPGMVKVDFSIPYSADNVYARHFKGVGIVLDKEAGIVAVDRNTVPIGLGDAEITFFGSLVVDAEVVFLHPRHNVALLRYNTSELAGAEFNELQLVDNDVDLPDTLTMVGYRADGTFRKHEVDDFSRLTVGFAAPRMARFQQSPIDLFGVSAVPPSLGGPFVDDEGKVHAYYMSFAYEEGREIRQNEWAMPASVIAETLRMYRSNSPYYSLDVKLAYKSISLARQFGLPDEWLNRYLDLPSHLRKVLYIEQVVPNTDAENVLMSGDILLAIQDELVADLLKAEVVSQQASVKLSVLRRGEVIDVELSPSTLNGTGTDRVVSWAGAHFQEPHQEIGYLKGVHFPGVYIAGTEQGSPALWDGLYRNRFVTHVDGVAVDGLDSFIGMVRKKAQDEVTRLSLVSISGRKSIVTVSPEYNFWPSYEIKRNDEGWQRLNLSN